MNDEIEKRLDAEAWSFARGRAWYERDCNAPIGVQAFQHGVKKRLQYNEKQWIKEMQEDDKTDEQKHHDEELKRLIEREKQNALISEKSWGLFTKALIPVSEDGLEVLSKGWKTVFVDPETGAKSPTVEKIVEGETECSDALAIKDPDLFMSKCVQSYDRCMFFTYLFDRAETEREDDYGKWRKSNNRYFEIKFALRAVKFPAKAPKT